MAFRDQFKYAPPEKYRPALIPYSRADIPAAFNLKVHQRVFSSSYIGMCALRTEPYGVPKKPQAPSPPAEGGAKKYPPLPGTPPKKTPPKSKPAPVSAEGGAKALAKAEAKAAPA
eukprot:1105747-Alexandrium_andersonii.AAC.1